MKLDRLHIRRVPGIDQPFTVDNLGAGMNIIVGPNAVGKSSLCRTVRALLWADADHSRLTSATAIFAKDDEHWLVTREGGRHQWEKDSADVEPPPLPPPHLQNCFFLELRDLLELSDSAGHTLATQIRRQMAGGFDLDDVIKGFSLSSAIGRRERKQFDTASARVRDVERQQREFGDEEASLEQLDEQLQIAKQAQNDLKKIVAALELVGWNTELTAKKAELEELPAVLEKLSGRELEQLTEREEELERKQNVLNEANTALEKAETAVEENQLSEPIDEAVLSVWRGNAEELSGLEQELKTLETDHQRLKAEVRKSAELLRGRAAAVPQVDVPGATELYRFLREAQDADTAERANLEHLACIGDPGFSEEDHARLRLLRGAIESLRSWMRAPDTGASEQDTVRVKRRKIGFIVAGLSILGGLIGIFWMSLFSAFIALGLGIGLTTIWLGRSMQSSSGERYAAETQFPANLEGPADWSVSAVTQSLRSFEDELAELESARRLDERRGQEREQLKKRLEPIALKKQEIEEQRQQLAMKLNLEQVLPDADLVDTLSAVDKVRHALIAEQGARGKVEDMQSRVNSCLSELNSALQDYGFESAGDAIEVKALIDQLGRSSERLRQAQIKVNESGDLIKNSQSDINVCKAKIEKIYQAASLTNGDRVGLEQLMTQIGGYRDLCSERDGLVNNVRRGEARLTELGAENLMQLNEQALEEKKESLDKQAESIDTLIQDITRIEERVRTVRSAHDQEDALAERAEKLSALKDAQGVAIHASVGRFLMDAVKQEHENTQLPRVLDRARELFALFTHQRYELRLAADEDKSFVAIETQTSERKYPDQLSDGTRAQLLVAVRLAFAEDAEQGDMVPLFLDEALDHADPHRFRAMVQSLGQIAEQRGRQIFYLTNDPADVKRIEATLAQTGAKEPTVIDLGAIRNQAASVDDAQALVVEDLPVSPLPESGEDSEAYAVRLGVPAFDPNRGANWQHLYYLTWDDTALLHRCLTAGIDSAGQWRMLSTQDSAILKGIIAGSRTAEQLDARVTILEEYCEAWKEGRGRQVPWEFIEDTGAVSNTFQERVADLLDELDGDGRQLIQILKSRGDPRVQSFRVASANALEKALIEEGFIDEREILGESDVLVRVLSTPVAEQLPAEIVRECVHRWWRLAGD